MDLVGEFDRQVELHRRRAELEATGIVAEARREAARIRMEAQGAQEQTRAQAELMLREAREEAANVRVQLATLRRSTLAQVRAMRDRIRSSLRDLEAILPGESDEERVIVLEEVSDRPVQRLSQPGPPPPPAPAPAPAPDPGSARAT
jgi:hypothetical protein